MCSSCRLMRCVPHAPMRRLCRSALWSCFCPSLQTKGPMCSLCFLTCHVSPQALSTHLSTVRCFHSTALRTRGGSGTFSLASSGRAFTSSSNLWNLITHSGTTESADQKAVSGERSGAEKPNTTNSGKADTVAAELTDSATENNPSVADTKEPAKEANKTAEKDGKSSAKADPLLKMDEVAKDKKAEPPSTADASTPEARMKRERLLDAEKNILFEEIVAGDEAQQLFNTTEVSTMKGLRWLDVSTSPGFFKDPLLAHIPEGQLDFSVMRKLFGSRFPIGVYANVASGATLPVTYVNENWACLILRFAKEVHQQTDELGGVLGAGSGRSSQHHRRRWWSLAKQWHDHPPADGDVDNAAAADNGDEDCVYDVATMDFYPRRVKTSQQWVQDLERHLRRRQSARRAAKAGFAKPPTASKTSSAAAGTAAALRHHHRHRSSSRRRPSLTMSDFSDRLTIFVGKELHPVETDPDAPKTEAATTAANEALALSRSAQRKRAARRSGKDHDEREEMATKADDSAYKTTNPSASAKEGETAPTHYEVRWRVVTVHRAPIAFISDMQSQWNKLTSHGGRSTRTVRSVPTNSRGPLDTEEIVRQALRRAARSGSMMEEEDEEEDNDGVYDGVHNTVIDRVEGWEDLVRLLYHGASRTLQESAYRNTRRLEVMETEIFDAPQHSAHHLYSMTRLMAELHLLSRETTSHNSILRESKVAYQKLKGALDHPFNLADQNEMLYVDSVLSISAHLAEQSESLLFLQFSVAMNQTEQHLRLLTSFNTFFIPLDFICTCCSSEVITPAAVSESKSAMYAAFGLLATTAVLTLRWIRRNLR
ncbi:hypothetical protein ABB37_03377 [Leptomonas pyrrhocoris]|uniref:Uncharacterized protein n=1 Tax=Leptomonas pyrrhocoris TaxID=157538 RepID=A0A0M9G515_LEPPY|nr:hypothetical protein ABB37_03377 [Leptomonas pyrrhocoris]KPA82269.1 hypothetical protein ABB37_03377 [Leptomonas pyrrhocoris]|eukprot:XP_015660708.1 hypothetical protein ABB37_03377 [Leptomonas pyrrhocoris]